MECCGINDAVYTNDGTPKTVRNFRGTHTTSSNPDPLDSKTVNEKFSKGQFSGGCFARVASLLTLLGL